MSYSRTHKDNLPKLKKHVECWHEYFKRNNQRFWDFTKFVCVTNISNKERTALQAVGKPQLEFNILEAQVSRLRGEFAKHSPSFEVRLADGIPTYVLTRELVESIDLIEGHLLALFGDNTNDALKYKFYSDILIGGFSVGEVLTQYVNPKSFEQKIEVQRVFDPTMTVFDPLARLSHKGDGQCAGKIVPMTMDDFRSQFPGHDVDKIKFSKEGHLGDFAWSYKNQQEDIILVGDLFIKKHKNVKIVKLTNGHVVPLKQYERLLEVWDEEGVMAVPPKILQERMTTLETICRYKFYSEGILDYAETDFDMFPLVFIDGNSVVVHGEEINAGTGIGTASNASSDNSPTTQITKPYIMHARDTQLLMNFAGQSLAGEMESIVQHQYIVAVEAIPEDQQEAYTTPQIASCLQYNHVLDKEAGIMLPPPQVLQRRQIPPELSNTFNSASNIMQMTLGNYDAILGINDKDISGKAIQAGALQSNAAALPYLMGFNNGLTRLAEIVVDLIPKYYRTPRTIPIVKPDGKHDYRLINDKDNPLSLMLDYDPKNLQIKVEMGTSSEMQKQVAIETLTRLSAEIPEFGNFINMYGLPVILDNLNIRGIDHLKELAEEYTQAKQQEAEANAQKPTEVEILAQTELQKTQMETEQQSRRAEMEAANKAAQLAVEKQKADIMFLELLAKVEADDKRAALEAERTSSQNAMGALKLATDMVKSTSKAKGD
jgi:hypothetical protein